MDQKRFIPFFAVSMLIFFGWAMLVRQFFPPEEVPPDQVVEVEGQDPDTPEPPDAVPAEPADPEDDPEARPPAENDPPADPDAPQPAPPAEEPPEWFTLGSMQSGDPYELAITLTTKGAAIESVELVSRDAKGNFRYRDLDNDSGYLGFLALTEAPGGGCRVETVTPGSPAALAGLQVGDLLLSIDDEPLTERLALRNWLAANSRPKQQVALEIRRNGQPQTLAATLTRRPLSVISPEYQMLPDGTLYEHQNAFLLSLERLGDAAPKRGEAEIGGMTSLREGHWKGKRLQGAEGAQGVEFSITLPPAEKAAEGATGLTIFKRYWLRPRGGGEGQNDPEALPGFDFSLELEFKSGNAPTELAYRLDGPTGLPTEGWWYSNKIHPRHFFNALGARDVIWSAPATGSLYVGTSAIVKQGEQGSKAGETELTTIFSPPQPAPFRYAGIDAQYFSCVLMPREIDDQNPGQSVPVLLRDAYAFPVSDLAPMKDDKGRFKTADVTYQLHSGLHELDANDSFKQEFTIFAGPKDPEILAPYELDDIISYGWFGVISKPLLKLLHFLYWVTGSVSYGLAIILLTLIVRSCLMPLGLKAARSAKKMQELAPEVKKLKEKYPDNLEKQWAAQQELFKKHNASQFGGCLPMFLQLPIFLGLYRGLATDIQLRQAPLIPGVEWCSNLAGPDKLFYWEPYLWPMLGGEMGWLGPYFNLLPVITVVLFYLHQKLFTPPAMDENQKQMQQVMSFMMIFFCVMFFKVPAGLCLYFITSSLWGLGERLFLKKDAKKNGGTELAVPAATEAKLAKVKVEKGERRKELARKQQKKR